MKRGTPDHPKTYSLATMLSIDPSGAVGILECLWHFAGRYAVQGDIGRWSDAEIAAGCKTSIDPSILVSALVKARWLDTSRTHRLVVHDWHDHADATARKYVKRNKLEFYSLNPEPGDVQTCPAIVQTCLTEPYTEPEPEPEPDTEPNPSTKGSSETAAPKRSRKRPSAKASPVDCPTVLRIPCRGGKGKDRPGVFELTQCQVDEWQALYDVPVLDQCKLALAWTKANPLRTKTHDGMKAFLVNWLNKAQNDPRRAASNGSGRPRAMTLDELRSFEPGD